MIDDKMTKLMILAFDFGSDDCCHTHKYKLLYRPAAAEWLQASLTVLIRAPFDYSDSSELGPQILPPAAMALSCCLLAGTRAAASPSFPSSAAIRRRGHRPLTVSVVPLSPSQQWPHGLRFCCASSTSSSPPPPAPPEEPDDYEVPALFLLLDFLSSPN